MNRTIAFAALLVSLVSLLASTALAGNGTSAVGPRRDSRVVALVASTRPMFGAAPASRDDARATFVYLHGMCGLTQNGCGHFDGAPGWLVCPQANRACGNGGSSWGGSIDEKIAIVDAALDASRAAWPESARAPVVLVGFSQGAYVAMDVARAQPGRYAGLVLLGADTRDVARFRDARVSRVALACGAYDRMFRVMRETPRALSTLGLASRFGSLGLVGHGYIAEDGTDDVLAALLAWVVAGEPPVRVLG